MSLVTNPTTALAPSLSAHEITVLGVVVLSCYSYFFVAWALVDTSPILSSEASSSEEREEKRQVCLVQLEMGWVAPVQDPDGMFACLFMVLCFVLRLWRRAWFRV